MIANIEINGFTIKIEDLEGKINITAEKEGEVIDEIVLDTEEFTESSKNNDEELPEGNDGELKTFDEFDKEESEEESEESEDSEDSDDDNNEPSNDNEELKEGLMTFNKFLKK